VGCGKGIGAQCACARQARRSSQDKLSKVMFRVECVMVMLVWSERLTLRKSMQFEYSINAIYQIAKCNRVNRGARSKPGQAFQVIRTTAPEKVKNAAAVVTRMMRAMRPLSAPSRSASSDTLLALGSADTSTITVSAKRSSGTPI